jgi:hypothetical protein
MLIILHVLTALVLLWAMSLLRDGERTPLRWAKAALMVVECANVTYLYQIAHNAKIGYPVHHDSLIVVECLNHFFLVIVFSLKAYYRKLNIKKYETTTH